MYRVGNHWYYLSSLRRVGGGGATKNKKPFFAVVENGSIHPAPYLPIQGQDLPATLREKILREMEGR